MIVEAQIIINGSKASVWDAITNIENASKIINGIEKIEVLEKATNGLIGLRWLETRMLFGKPVTVEKRIIDASENMYYRTRTEDQGFVFLTTLSIFDSNDGVVVKSSHETKPQGIIAGIKSIPMVLFKGVIKKAVKKDLMDIKLAVEQK